MSNCHIYFEDSWLSVSPSVISLAKIFSKHFDNVYIYMQKTLFKPYKFSEKNIHTFYIYNSIYWKVENKARNLERKVLNLINKRKLLRDNDFFVCIDKSALSPAGKALKNYNLNLCYLALELPDEDRVSNENRELFLKSNMVLVQDEPRLEKLLELYGVDKNDFKSKVFYLPNDSLPISTNSKKKNVIEQFHDKNIENKAICASIGMLSSAVYANNIARVFCKINNAVLLFHDRMKIKFRHKNIKDIINLKCKNIYLSRILYDFDELELVYKPIDIGIACYSGYNNDHSVIGKSSGKLCFYLKYSKPVIVNRQRGLSDIIEQYDCGVVINDVDNAEEWQNAIDKIMNNYAYYSENAKKCYLKEYSFEEKIKPFEDYIINIYKQ